MEKYEGYNLRLRDAHVGVQFLFVAFGALVLVPILTGLDTSVALFTAGIGTLLFQLITRKHVPPIFLASSFVHRAAKLRREGVGDRRDYERGDRGGAFLRGFEPAY